VGIYRVLADSARKGFAIRSRWESTGSYSQQFPTEEVRFMCPRVEDHVVIEGQRFVESDETMYVLASDIVQGVSDDLEGVADSDAEPGSRDDSARFGPIAEVMELLERRMPHEASLSWVVTPNDALGGRPLDLVTEGRAAEVLAHIRELP
jgi:hypothetical protein